MPNWGDVQNFLEAVVPWPGDQPGHVNLHYSMVNPYAGEKGQDPLLKGMGWPFRDLSSFIQRTAWIGNTSNFKDVWFCTSRQRESATNTQGKPKALRRHANAMDLKAIWIDADVKPDDTTGKHYTTFQEAWAALCDFRTKVGLPQFSAVVNSGGGLHAYWISDRALTPEEWLPYATGLKALLLQEGVKCDAGLTTDDVRLLRVPGTYNHKYNPPREVELLPLPLVKYELATSLAFLTMIAPVPASVTQTLPASFHGVTPLSIPLASDSLADGIEKREERLLDPRPVFAGCAFLRNAFANGGADLDNPLWNLSVLATTFMENGNAFAHQISQGHATYTPADTQALYDRKVADRADRGIGYPSCATIAGNGCKSCAACPHFAKGKSPLNLTKPLVTAAVSAPAAPTQTSLHLPSGYDLDHEGFICLVAEKTTKTGSESTHLIRLFTSKLDMPWSQKNPDGIHCRTTYDKGNYFMAFLPWEKMGANDLFRTFAQQKIKIAAPTPLVRDFYMAWLTYLHELEAAQETLPYGWYRDQGNIKGFAYGGMLFKDDGSTGPAGITQGSLRTIYTTTGQMQPWYDAWEWLKVQKRPELEAVIASAFAGPLMPLLGKAGGMLSIEGESGSCKTHAMELGIAVWGSPQKGKEISSSTKNSIMNKAGQLNNLPIFWDEITQDNPKVRNEVLAALMEFTNGIEKSRMLDGERQQGRYSWESMTVISSNCSFWDFVVQKQKTHTGGFNRVLEYNIRRLPLDAGILTSSTEADIALKKLNYNFGHLGAEYAKFLAMNHARAADEVRAMGVLVEQELTIEQEERYWSSLVAALLCGAKYANEVCRVGFDEEALKDFLYRRVLDGRTRRNRDLRPAAAQDSIEDILTGYLKERTNQTIWTDFTPHRPGHFGGVNVLREPPVSNNFGINVRWDVTSRKLMISRPNFNDWLRIKELAVNETHDSLEKNYGMVTRRITLAAGTRHQVTQEHCLVIDVTGKQALEECMDFYKQQDSSQPNPVDTGIVLKEEAA